VTAQERLAFDVPRRVRAMMVALGTIPVLHAAVAAIPLVAVSTGAGRSGLIWLAPALLYLLPPLVVRTVLLWRPLPVGRVPADDPGFLTWWFTAQWQVLFVRLPFLEELLRVVPGLYSLWLRLWGARIGSLVYWAPGVVILDRQLLRVGRGVIFGMAVRINPHVIAPMGDGRVGLHIGPITIEDGALIGGYSLLLPGSSVAAGACTRPFRSVHAFTRAERTTGEPD
jgi:hypothetical protein